MYNPPIILLLLLHGRIFLNILVSPMLRNYKRRRPPPLERSINEPDLDLLRFMVLALDSTSSATAPMFNPIARTDLIDEIVGVIGHLLRLARLQPQHNDDQNRNQFLSASPKTCRVVLQQQLTCRCVGIIPEPLFFRSRVYE